ncbi:phosphatidylinositol-glycan-specific phospholipase D isoformX1 [Mucor ambiguus]|uniref:Phosphatidylinositol-glycan-specific phospholipase D n=1 Tax=Mucor ambiguus TaxID=91626 RepID=A0A0C9LVR1_9FUNG|nr:phosphatidylinositol-glycan-specific phospholipase D isoformX1 [Mucor ambiguus]
MLAGSVLSSAVHNEVTFRSLEHFAPKSAVQQLYKDDLLDSASYTQAGSFFPDWGYQCLGNNQQSEDAHWPSFIKTAVNYIREVYPATQFHTDTHVKGLISFVFAIMSHGMADVKWHSLSGLQDYFIVAMAKSDFHGNAEESHIAADAGAEFTLRHSSKLSYLNETWKVPVNDIIEIYKRLYESSGQRIPLASHIQYCMAAAFAASKIDVEFGQLMFGYYGSKSPFLIEELYDYYRGGIEDLSGSVSDCYPELVNAFENGAKHDHPDTLCASYFFSTATAETSKRARCLNHRIQSPQRTNRKDAGNKIYHDYDATTGVLTLTVNKTKQIRMAKHDDMLPRITTTVVSPTLNNNHNKKHAAIQQPFGRPVFDSNPVTNADKVKTGSSSNGLDKYRCLSLYQEREPMSKITLTIPMSSSRVGHQIVSGHFRSSSNNGDPMDIAISAPFYCKDGLQIGAVFLLDSNLQPTNIDMDIRNVSHTVLHGDTHHGRFGWSMAVLDLNKDGIDDLAIATPFNDRVDVYFGQAHTGLSESSSARIQLQSQGSQGTVLAGIDVDQDGFKDLVIGCPLCPVGNQPQAGKVSIYLNYGNQLTQPHFVIENPDLNAYDHFGESILIIQDTLLISAPSYSVGQMQRVGRVYAFDTFTYKLKWTITGTKEFQQYGKVLATNERQDTLAISSPSEETKSKLQTFWQGGTVRLYDWSIMQQEAQYYVIQKNVVPDIAMEHGMMGLIEGRTNAGHLGQSIMMGKDDMIWIGEPMSEQENGRVYQWWYKKTHELKCIRNGNLLARFGSQIGSLGPDAICITSQRYGQNAQYSGAVNILAKPENERETDKLT